MGKCSRAFNIKDFLVTDRFEKSTVQVAYFPTDKMDRDFMTKPLQGIKLKTFYREILDLTFRATIGNNDISNLSSIITSHSM